MSAVLYSTYIWLRSVILTILCTSDCDCTVAVMHTGDRVLIREYRSHSSRDEWWES